MENASKALIIAGAILIAILLISVGILVMNSMNKPIDQAASESDSMSAQIYNSKFIPYFGDRVSGRDLKTLLQQIMINNSGKDENDAITLVVHSIDPNTGEYNANPSYSGLFPGKVKHGHIHHIYTTEHINMLYNFILNNKYYKVGPSINCTDNSNKPGGYFSDGKIGCIKIEMLNK